MVFDNAAFESQDSNNRTLTILLIARFSVQKTQQCWSSDLEASLANRHIMGWILSALCIARLKLLEFLLLPHCQMWQHDVTAVVTYRRMEQLALWRSFCKSTYRCDFVTSQFSHQFFFPCWKTIILLLTRILFLGEMQILRSKYMIPRCFLHL